MLFMEDNRTGMTCFHNLVASAQFGAIFHNAQGFEKSVKTKSTVKLDLTASGYTLSLFGKALAGGKSAVALKFDGAPGLKGIRGQPYPSLYGWMVEGSGKQLVLMNLSATAPGRRWRPTPNASGRRRTPAPGTRTKLSSGTPGRESATSVRVRVSGLV